MKFSQSMKKHFGEMAEIFFYNQLREVAPKLEIRQVDNTYDYEVNKIPVEVKSAQICIARTHSRQGKINRFRYNWSGFTVSFGQHEDLLEKKGWYCFVPMRRDDCLLAVMIPANKVFNHFMYKAKPTVYTRVSFSVLYAKNAISVPTFASRVEMMDI